MRVDVTTCLVKSQARALMRSLLAMSPARKIALLTQSRYLKQM